MLIRVSDILGTRPLDAELKFVISRNNNSTTRFLSRVFWETALGRDVGLVRYLLKHVLSCYVIALDTRHLRYRFTER